MTAMKRAITLITIITLLFAACLSQKTDDQGLTCAHFIEDLDYMLNVLENNFSLYDLANWSKGIDINAIFDDLKAIVLSDPNMETDTFFELLWRSFYPLHNSTGHFSVISPNDHYNRTQGNMIALNRAFLPDSPHFPLSSPLRLREPKVLGFYEPRYSNTLAIGEAIDISEWEDYIYEQFIFRAEKYGEKELGNSFKRAIHEENYTDAYRYLSQIQSLIQSIPNVHTNIIEEGRIAYLSLESFMNLPGSIAGNLERAQIIDFISSVKDYDHLIIDIRTNAGGNAYYFFDLFISTNILSRQAIEGFAFFTHGDYTDEFLNARQSGVIGRTVSPISRLRTIDDDLLTVPEILSGYNLPEIKLSDMDRMDYGFPVILEIGANPGTLSSEMEINSKIWLLISEYSMSAAHIVPWVVKEMGFATLVGNTTGGYWGGYRSYSSLPNTGILFQFDMLYLTDRTGYPLEAGIKPDHFNREGMNALETVLALIYEASNN
ncbi:MAG: S41 family peptidase [Treponema sp.]|nr:S41 family peptidase [Treponema sp.]